MGSGNELTTVEHQPSCGVSVITMKHLSRITALFAGFLFLHLVVGGAGLLHAMPSCQAQEASEQEAGPPGMKMDMSQSDGSEAGDAQAPASGPDGCEGHSSNTGCPSAAPCPIPPICSGENGSLVPSDASARVSRLYVPVPPFRTTPPDLPPPRA